MNSLVFPHVAAARTRSESEARAEIAERAQAAFLSVVKTASELTSVGLPDGKTVAVAEIVGRALMKPRVEAEDRRRP